MITNIHTLTIVNIYARIKARSETRIYQIERGNSMEKSEYRLFITNHGNEIKQQLKKILQNDPMFLAVGNFNFIKKGRSELYITLRDVTRIRIVINPKSLPTRIYLGEIVDTCMNVYIENMHEKIETQMFKMLQNRLPNDFFEKLTEKVQEEMQETGMIVKITEHSIKLGTIEDGFLYEEKLEKCWNYKSFISTTYEKIWNTYQIPTNVKLTCEIEKMLEKSSEEIVTYLLKTMFVLDKVQEKTIEEKKESIYNTFKEKECKYLYNENVKPQPLKYTFHCGNIVHLCASNDQIHLDKSNGTIAVSLLGKFEKRYNTICSSEFQDAKIKLLEYLKRNNVVLSDLVGDGLFMGHTTFRYLGEKILINDPYNEQEKWIDNLIFMLNRKFHEIKSTQSASFHEISTHFLAHDIVEFVRLNEEYITENAITQYMRGNQVQLSTYIHGIDHRIRYETYSADEIKRVIKKLIREDVLITRSHNGHYGKFETIELGNKDLEEIKISYVDEYTTEEWNDYTAEWIFKKYAKKDILDVKEYLILLKFQSLKGFMAKYGDTYLQLLKSGPEQFKIIVKMKRETENDDNMKKFYRKILRK